MPRGRDDTLTDTFFLNCVHQFWKTVKFTDGDPYVTTGIKYGGYELYPKYDENGKKRKNPYSVSYNEILVHNYDKKTKKLMEKYPSETYLKPLEEDGVIGWEPDSAAPYSKESYRFNFKNFFKEVKSRHFSELYEKNLQSRSIDILTGMLMYPHQARAQLSRVKKILQKKINKKFLSLDQYLSSINNDLYGWNQLLSDYYIRDYYNDFPSVAKKSEKILIGKIDSNDLKDLEENDKLYYYQTEFNFVKKDDTLKIYKIGIEDINNILKQEVKVIDIYLNFVNNYKSNER